MSKLTFNADPSKGGVAPQQPFEAIPRESCGWMRAKLTASELKPVSTGKGKLINFVAEILEEGDYKGRRVFDKINIENPSAAAQGIGQAQLSAICHATRVYKFTDTAQLHDIPFQLKVGYEGERKATDGSEYEARNNFKGFKPLEGGGAAATSAGAPAGKWGKAPANPPPAAVEAPPPEPTPESTTEADKREFSFYDGSATQGPLSLEELASAVNDGAVDPATTPISVDGGDWSTVTALELDLTPSEPVKTPDKLPPPPPSAKVPAGKLPWKKK